MSENFWEMKNPFDDVLQKYTVIRFIRHCLSIPFIYGVLFPAVIMDVFVSLYNQVAFPLYGVPVVDRSEYVVFERRHLRYLGPVQRLNCWYCSYLNGLFAYFVEVGARTELYWCPIKSVSRPVAPHRLYKGFAAYGDAEAWAVKNHSTESAKKEHDLEAGS